MQPDSLSLECVRAEADYAPEGIEDVLEREMLGTRRRIAVIISTSTHAGREFAIPVRRSAKDFLHCCYCDTCSRTCVHVERARLAYTQSALEPRTATNSFGMSFADEDLGPASEMFPQWPAHAASPALACKSPALPLLDCPRSVGVDKIISDAAWRGDSIRATAPASCGVCGSPDGRIEAMSTGIVTDQSGNTAAMIVEGFLCETSAHDEVKKCPTLDDGQAELIVLGSSSTGITHRLARCLCDLHGVN